MIKIAVPDNQIYSPLLENAEEAAKKFNVQLIKTSEKQCRDMLLNNSVDAVLGSPLAYGLGTKEADFRIINGPAFAIDGYSPFLNVFIKPNLKTIESFAIPNKDDFPAIVAEMILSERYGIELEMTSVKNIDSETLDNFDAVFHYTNTELTPNSMNLTEDWTDTFDTCLPLAFWICRAEEHPENIENIVKEFAAQDLIKEEDIFDENDEEMQYGREGKIFWAWNQKIEDDLSDILELLFMRGFISEVGKIKILGEEPPTLDE